MSRTLARIAAEYAALLDMAPDVETIAGVLEAIAENPCVTAVERDYLDTVAERRERALRGDLNN